MKEKTGRGNDLFVKMLTPLPLTGNSPCPRGEFLHQNHSNKRCLSDYCLYLGFPWNKVGVYARNSYKFSPWTRGVPRSGEGCEYFYKKMMFFLEVRPKRTLVVKRQYLTIFECTKVMIFPTLWFAEEICRHHAHNPAMTHD